MISATRLMYILCMIQLLKHGIYTVIETRGHVKILILDSRKVFAWIHAGEIGEILVASHKTHKADHILSTGRYRMYDVKDEPKFIDIIHLELLVGDGVWQGYLLPTGLPRGRKTRNRIIPTREIITKSTD